MWFELMLIITKLSETKAINIVFLTIFLLAFFVVYLLFLNFMFIEIL